MKYWNKQGKYQAAFEHLTDTLMPPLDNAGTLGGELIRAANRLAYDAYNNGFCNNTSGAINYIKVRLLPHIDTPELRDAIRVIEPKTNSGGYSNVSEIAGTALDTIIDHVVEFNQNFPALATAETDDDMFNWQEDDYYPEEDESDWND